jgi:hypothetical protein
VRTLHKGRHGRAELARAEGPSSVVVERVVKESDSAGAFDIALVHRLVSSG